MMKRFMRIFFMALGFAGIIIVNDIGTFSLEFFITMIGVILVSITTHIN